MKLRKFCLACGAFVSCFTIGPTAAVDGISLELGQGNGANMGRVGVQWVPTRQWFKGERWHVRSAWDLSLGHWTRDALPGQNDSITEISLTPLLRLQQNNSQGLYAEGGVGLHLLSSTTLGWKRFSTAVQFGSHLGLGYRFGAKGAIDLGLRYQHLSNAGIKRPNDGINFTQVRVQYWF